MTDKTVEFKIAVKTDGTGPALETLRQKLQGVVGDQGTVAAAAEQSSTRQVASHRKVSDGPALETLRQRLQGVVGEQGSVAVAAEQSSTRQVASHRKVSDGVTSISTQLNGLKTQMLGLVGIGVGAQGIKDVVALADGYKNLESRIKLTTGEGKAFDTAFQGVFDVAKRTNSAVEETGVLFTKLAEAGKTLGVGQAEALRLTETINQSIQLSGASAEASKASIIQLVQGLQSGALRGDEFNSVMEQAPRLAKALADGLGVTTGELRKMAEAGQLTSAAVIESLQKQSAAIAGEFDKLPATVGRAMTNLSTEFTRYVGEADKAGGYTAKLGAVIDTLAGNLSTVATVMIHTGQALGAMKLLAMAQDWLTASAAIKATAASTEMATVSTIRSTAAKVQNTVATAANTAAQTANAAAWGSIAAALGGVGPHMQSAGTQAAAATVPVTAFGAALKFLKGFVLLDIALNFKQYGTAIGEAAAKLMGYKDRTEELAAAEKTAALIAAENATQRSRMAAALKEATDRSFELGKAGSELVAKFDEMRKAGDSAATAIGNIGKDFDLANVPGIKNAVAVLDKLQADGKISAGEFQKAWTDALKVEDLAAFETRAIAAFKGTAREAERMGQIMDASLRESIRRAALDFALISDGMGKASASAINDTEAMIKGLDRLKAMGVDTARALTASIGKGIDTADSEKALGVVKSQIEAVRKVLGDKVADGLLDQAKQKAIELKDALDAATPGITSVREAMKLLGVTSDETLKNIAAQSKTAFETLRNSGTASTRELSAGFERYATDAIAANKGVASEGLKVQASMYGMEVQVDSTGKAIVKAIGTGTEAVQQHRDAVDQTTGAYLALRNAAYEATSEIGKLRAAEAAAARKDGQFLTAGYLEDQAKWEDKIANGKKTTSDKDGFATDTNGNRIAVPIQTQRSVYENAKGQGLSEAQALAIAKQFISDTGEITGHFYTANFKAGENWFTEVQKAIDKLVLANAANNAATGTPGSPTTTVNVRITLPDGSIRVVPTTADGSRELIAALQSAKLSAGL